MCATASDRITPVPVALPRRPAGTPTPVPTSAPSDMRVTLDSLPVPLRVTAGDQSEHGIAFEAELPWLAVGTGVDVELPNGVHQTGWIHSFDMGATPTGSARLRIFAGVSPPENLSSELPARPVSRPNEARRARPGCGGWPSSPAPPSEPSLGGKHRRCNRCSTVPRSQPSSPRSQPCSPSGISGPYRPPANNCVKNSGTDSPSGRPAATPIPTWVTRGSRTAARWPGLDMNPRWAWSAL